MNSRNIRAFIVSAIGLAALALPGLAAQPTTIDFSGETAGAEPKAIVPVVGIWRIENEAERRCSRLTAGSGRRGSRRRELPTRHARSMANATRSFSTVCKPTPTFLTRSCPTWTISQAARSRCALRDCRSYRSGRGILFNLKPNGDYLTIRANCLENNLVLWKFEKGKRSSVKWVRNTPTATKQWHELKVRVAGTKVEGYLDGKLYLEDTLTQPVSGRIGLWSKADSHMYFSDYTVTAAD